MKFFSRFMYFPLFVAGLLLGCTAFAGNTAIIQQQGTASAMDRGYRTGYTDGYQVGYVDFSNKSEKNFRDHPEYRSANRAYVDAYGTVEDYKDGYRQGFEAGYVAAYDRKPFESAIPANLKRQGDDGLQRQGDDNSRRQDDDSVRRQGDDNSKRQDDDGGRRQNDDNSRRQDDDGVRRQDNDSPRRQGNNDAVQNSQNPDSDIQNGPRPRDLPANSILRVELLSDITTDVSQKGDPFQARVIEPHHLSGAILKGHIAFIKRPGRIKGSGEIQLAFDQIIVEGGQPVPFDALVTELIEQGVRETASVDSEGGVKGRDSTKDDVSKVGAGTAVGAIIGAIAGGGKGAAIGAVVGGGASTGGVLATRGKDLRLHRGQQLKIQTAKETRW